MKCTEHRGLNNEDASSKPSRTRRQDVLLSIAEWYNIIVFKYERNEKNNTFAEQ